MEKTPVGRQNEEFTLIKNKFGNNVEDLRNENGEDTPLDIRILLTPLRDSCGNAKTSVSTKLHIVCPDDYPGVVPTLLLEQTKGISSSLINNLLKILQQKALELRGQPMILELVQTVQAFLINNNKRKLQFFVIPTMSSSYSRIKTEFEELDHLGKGAFGDVLKVKNILDSQKYAIKRIPLEAKSQTLCKKMTREVELMSRLNHKNVVRYYNSWIESAPNANSNGMDKIISDDWSKCQESNPITPSTADTEKSFSKDFISTADYSESDDGILFVDSNGEMAVYDEESDDDVEETASSVQTTTAAHVMYIQMEFCGNFTLRTVIDRDSLRPSLLWRLFREILEGLCYIHKQSIIHRDLKPGNIFLDSSFNIKIGDFGQATKTYLAVRPHKYVNYVATSTMGTGTGEVGTELYVAPELMGDASKCCYDQKVDMYPLGIILFEMIHPSFKTTMERINSIRMLRNGSVLILNDLPNDANHGRAVQIIRSLLDHDATKRPSTTDLLKSQLVPSTQPEAEQLKRVLGYAFADPQSKAHKHLVARCLQQKSDDILQHTYHQGSCVSQDPAIEFVKSKVVNVFRKHGAIEVDIPFLTPISKASKVSPQHVRLMTRSGGVVVLPYDLRSPFVWHIVMSGVNFIRRYSVDRVFKERKEDNLHPEQKLKCCFDIITPKTSNNLIDAEILSIAHEIVMEIPRLLEQNIYIRLNHTSLLRSILIYSKVPIAKHALLFQSIRAHLAGRKMSSQIYSAIKFIRKSKISANILINLLLSDIIVDDSKNIADEPVLKCLLQERGKVSSMAKRAIRELEDTIMLAKNFGVTVPIHVCPGLAIGSNPDCSTGIVWQMINDLPFRKPIQLAVGERYDKMIATYQKKSRRSMANVHKCGSISGVGLTFSLQNLATACVTKYDNVTRALDVCVSVFKDKCELKDITDIMRDLWSAGIRCGTVEVTTLDEVQYQANNLGAVNLIMIGKDVFLIRVLRPWGSENYEVQCAERSELVKCIQELLKDGVEPKTPIRTITHKVVRSISYF